MEQRGVTPGDPPSHAPRNARNRLRLLVVLIWSGTLLVICCCAYLSARSHSVYPIFSGAARNWRAGLDLYQSTEEPYRYSPLVAILLVPFSQLPDTLGGVAWRMLNAGVLLGALGWWCRSVLGPGTRANLLFLLILPLAVGSLHNGQSNALVLGLLLTALVGAATERWGFAAACTALATLFKLYPITLGLLLAAAFPRRFAGRLALALGIGLALPFALQQPTYVLKQYGGWLHHLRTDHRQDLPVELWYRDLRLLCHTAGLPVGDQSYAAVQLLAAAAIAVVTVAGRRAGWTRRQLLRSTFALACCWMTFLGPATESCTYILLAPALAEALLERERWPRWARGGLAAGYALLVAAQAAVWFPFGRQVQALGPQPLGALIVFVCLLAVYGIAPFVGRMPSASEIPVEGVGPGATIAVSPR
jgi:hypothetical protein